jgi:hypothetical protein
MTMMILIEQLSEHGVGGAKQFKCVKGVVYMRIFLWLGQVTSPYEMVPLKAKRGRSVGKRIPFYHPKICDLIAGRRTWGGEQLCLYNFFSSPFVIPYRARRLGGVGSRNFPIRYSFLFSSGPWRLFCSRWCGHLTKDVRSPFALCVEVQFQAEETIRYCHKRSDDLPRS